MSVARERLLQAIKDVDAEIFGERAANQVLTNYVVVVAHRELGDDADDDSDAVARISMPGQAAWQTLGLLRAEALYVEAHMLSDDES